MTDIQSKFSSTEQILDGGLGVLPSSYNSPARFRRQLGQGSVGGLVCPLDCALRLVSRVTAGLDTEVGANYGADYSEQGTQYRSYIRGVLEYSLKDQHGSEGNGRRQYDSQHREPETVRRTLLRVLCGWWMYYGLCLLFSWRRLPCARLNRWITLSCRGCSCSLTVGIVGHDASFHL